MLDKYKERVVHLEADIKVLKTKLEENAKAIAFRDKELERNIRKADVAEVQFKKTIAELKSNVKKEMALNKEKMR